MTVSTSDWKLYVPFDSLEFGAVPYGSFNGIMIRWGWFMNSMMDEMFLLMMMAVWIMNVGADEILIVLMLVILDCLIQPTSDHNTIKTSIWNNTTFQTTKWNV